MTSAFQCITASATPVPSLSKDGKDCYKFGNREVYGKGGRNHGSRKGRREEGAPGSRAANGGIGAGKSGGFFGRFGRPN